MSWKNCLTTAALAETNLTAVQRRPSFGPASAAKDWRSINTPFNKATLPDGNRRVGQTTNQG
jgi:hypothetical protein